MAERHEPHMRGTPHEQLSRTPQHQVWDKVRAALARDAVHTETMIEKIPEGAKPLLREIFVNKFIADAHEDYRFDRDAVASDMAVLTACASGKQLTVHDLPNDRAKYIASLVSKVPVHELQRALRIAQEEEKNQEGYDALHAILWEESPEVYLRRLINTTTNVKNAFNNMQNLTRTHREGRRKEVEAVFLDRAKLIADQICTDHEPEMLKSIGTTVGFCERQIRQMPTGADALVMEGYQDWSLADFSMLKTQLEDYLDSAHFLSRATLFLLDATALILREVKGKKLEGAAYWQFTFEFSKQMVGVRHTGKLPDIMPFIEWYREFLAQYNAYKKFADAIGIDPEYQPLPVSS